MTYPLQEGVIVQDFRSKQEKNIEMLLFRIIDTIASKKRLFTILATAVCECELKPMLFLIILDCTRKKNEEKL